MYKCPTCDHVFEYGGPQPLAVCPHCVEELQQHRGATGSISLEEEEWRRAGIPARKRTSSGTYICIIMALCVTQALLIWRLETLQQEQAECVCAEKVQR